MKTARLTHTCSTRQCSLEPAAIRALGHAVNTFRKARMITRGLAAPVLVFQRALAKPVAAAVGLPS